MSKLARVLIAATSSATLASAASYAEPTDNVVIDQSNDGSSTSSEDITADQTETIITSPFAQANSTTGLIGRWTDYTGRQSMTGTSDATTNVLVDNAWSYVTSTATALGNAVTIRGDANVDVDLVQNASAGTRTGALSDLRITTYGAHTVQTANATMNAAEVSTYGERDVVLTQNSEGDTEAATRLDASTAEIETVAQGVSAAGNSLLVAGGEFARAQVDQTQSGDVTAEASADVRLADFGVVSASQAAGNTVTLFNDFGYGETRGSQTNAGNVRAVTNLDLGGYENGLAVGSANAVGNTALTSVISGDAFSGLAQTNTGAVSSTVNFNGGAGGGLGTALSSTAMGNAQSAYICSTCPVGLEGAFTQSNSGAVTSQINANHSGYVRSITSSSSALGNVATFSNQSGG
jgi:hypothetical protein